MGTSHMNINSISVQDYTKMKLLDLNESDFKLALNEVNQYGCENINKYKGTIIYHAMSYLLDPIHYKH